MKPSISRILKSIYWSFTHCSFITIGFILNFFSVRKRLCALWSLCPSWGFSLVWRASCPRQWASTQPITVKYCSSRTFLSSAASSALGVYRSTQWAQFVQLATREMIFPFDSCSDAQRQGSKYYQIYTFHAIWHKEIKGFQIQPTILNIFPFDLRPHATPKSIIAKLLIEI